MVIIMTFSACHLASGWLVLLPIACVGCGGQTTTNVDRALTQSSESSGTAVSPPIEIASARQIITKATFNAETRDMDGLSQALSAQVAKASGFVANFAEQRYAGERRGGTWTIRLPNSQFDAFVQWLDKNVTITGRELSAQDVSEEVVDLAARLSNKKNTGQRLTKLLNERAGKLDELLSVEREIDRVHEEVERLDGRQRFLQDRISLCTITLTVSTRINAAIVQSPTFAIRVSETWTSSLSALRDCFEGFTLFAIGLVPWLPILSAIGYLFYRLAKKVSGMSGTFLVK